MTKSEDSVLSYRKWIMAGAPEDTSPEVLERQWQAAVDYIRSGAPATLCTLNRDGRPQQSLVWVGVEDDNTLFIAHTMEYLKVKNMRRDPRVSISFASGSKNSLGVHEYLVIEGTAEVTVGGAVEALKKIAPQYMGKDDDMPMDVLATNTDGWVSRITPTRMRGWGPWQEASQH